MDFRVENFISPKNLQTLTRTGLHKTAGALNGIDEMTIKQAVAIIGYKARQKRAEAKIIQAGIKAYADLQGEKSAGVSPMKSITNWLPHMLQGVPAGLLGGGIGYALSPKDPQEEQRMMQQGALMGLLGGTLHSVHRGL